MRRTRHASGQFWFGTQRTNFRDQSHHERFFKDDIRVGANEFLVLDRSVYDRLLKNHEYRTLFDGNAHATDLRHYNLTVPNGFDPFTTVLFRREVEQYTALETNRIFRIDVMNEMAASLRCPFMWWRQRTRRPTANSSPHLAF